MHAVARSPKEAFPTAALPRRVPWPSKSRHPGTGHGRDSASQAGQPAPGCYLAVTPSTLAHVAGRRSSSPRRRLAFRSTLARIALMDVTGVAANSVRV